MQHQSGEIPDAPAVSRLEDDSAHGVGITQNDCIHRDTQLALNFMISSRSWRSPPPLSRPHC